MKKLAVFFPGIGYTNDKPLMHYSRRISRAYGYEEMLVEYHDLPSKVRGDMAKMKEACEKALLQADEQLSKVNFKEYDEVVFVGKSIGTVLAARLASKYAPEAKKVLYTPVEATFSAPVRNAMAFIGENDPWSVLADVVKLADEAGVKLYRYPGCNHSLESGDISDDLTVIMEVMQKTEEFIR